MSLSSLPFLRVPNQPLDFAAKTDKCSIWRLVSWDSRSRKANNFKSKTNKLGCSSCVKMCATASGYRAAEISSSGAYEKSKRVWIWTQSKQVMTCAIERGWNTFLFSSKHRQLAEEWSYIISFG
uniref:Uncharacterized protein LOC105643334 n=1 Tax=Rhizophora mucronata TaxID=61149 RepID=A0A2P2K602_RHIMU